MSKRSLVLALLGAGAACTSFSASPGDGTNAPDAGADGAPGGGDDAPGGPTDGGPDAKADADTDAAACPGAASCPRVMFVTSTAYSPGVTLGSVSAGDAICNALAASPDAGAGVKGRTFFAWLSQSDTSPATRKDIVHGTGPYIRPDGVQVAASWTALLATNIDHAPNVDEQGALGPGSGFTVWTGTSPAGEDIAGGDCTSWNVVTSTGFIGKSSATDGAWTDYIGGNSCQAMLRIYCIEK